MGFVVSPGFVFLICLAEKARQVVREFSSLVYLSISRISSLV